MMLMDLAVDGTWPCSPDSSTADPLIAARAHKTGIWLFARFPFDSCAESSLSLSVLRSINEELLAFPCSKRRSGADGGTLQPQSARPGVLVCFQPISSRQRAPAPFDAGGNPLLEEYADCPAPGRPSRTARKRAPPADTPHSRV